MPELYVDNYIVKEPLINILYHLQSILNNGKLKDIIEKKDEIVCTCPNDLHDGGQENNPDCHIITSDDKDYPYGTHNCFACNSSGSFIHFVALCFSSSITYAKQWLIKNYGILGAKKIKLADPIPLTKAIKQVGSTINPKVLDSLQDYCPYMQSRHISKLTCQFLNIKYDNVNKAVVFPCYDKAGNLVMVPSRSTLTKFFHLDEDIDRPLYCIDKIAQHNIDKFLIVEGPIDAATCWEYNVPAVACLGAVTDEQISAVNKLHPRVVFIATDNDFSGKKFAKLISEQLNNTILKIRVELPANRKDVNDLTVDEWHDLIEKYHLPVLKIK